MPARVAEVGGAAVDVDVGQLRQHRIGGQKLLGGGIVVARKKGIDEAESGQGTGRSNSGRVEAAVISQNLF